MYCSLDIEIFYGLFQCGEVAGFFLFSICQIASDVGSLCKECTEAGCNRILLALLNFLSFEKKFMTNGGEAVNSVNSRFINTFKFFCVVLQPW